MKVTATQTVQLWNCLNQLLEINDPHPFFGYAKRLCVVYLRKEVELWNSLSIAEREAIMNEKIEIPVRKVKLNELPPFIPDEAYQALEPIIDGKIPEPQPAQLAKLLMEAQNGKAKPTVRPDKD